MAKTFAASFFSVLLVCAGSASADLIEIGLSTANDGKITRDTVSGLDWADPTVTLGRSWSELESEGPDGWLAAGWTSATSGQVCAFFATFSLAAPTCPVSFLVEPNAADVEAFVWKTSFPNLFGLPSSVSGYYGFSDTGYVGLGSVGDFAQTGQPPFRLAFVVEPLDLVYPEYASDPKNGHFLVRPVNATDSFWPTWPQLATSTRTEELGAFPYSEQGGGVTFRVWAPNARRVAVLDMDTLGDEFRLDAAEIGWTAYLAREDADPHCLADPGGPWDCDCMQQPEAEGCTGIWSGDVPGVDAGAEYQYLTAILGNRTPWTRRDPRAVEITTADSQWGRSVVYDHTSFDWQGNPGPDGEYAASGEASLVFYHTSIPKFAPEPNARGMFATAQGAIGHLAELGVNAVQLMPVTAHPSPGATNSFIPGNPYAVSDPFAIDATFGGPDEYKRLVRELHRAGIGIFQDVVYTAWSWGMPHTEAFDGWRSGPLNTSDPDYASEEHFGYGIYHHNNRMSFTEYKGWRPNYAKPEVLDYLIDNVETFLDDFHVDGYRIDSSAQIRFDPEYTVTGGREFTIQANQAIHFRDKYSFGEDIFEVCPDAPEEPCDDPIDELDYDATWVPLGQVYCPLVRVFVRAQPVTTPLPAVCQDTSSANKWVRLAQVVTGNGRSAFELVYYTSDVYIEMLAGMKPIAQVMYDALEDPLVERDAIDIRRATLLSSLVVLTSPQIPMIAAGQETFRETAVQAFDLERKNLHKGVFQFHKDLIQLRTGARGGAAGLRGEYVDAYRFDPPSNVVAYRRGAEAEVTPGDVVVVLNLDESAVGPSDLPPIGMPRPGTWTVRFNADDPRYGDICDPTCDSDFGGVGPGGSVTTVQTSADNMDDSATFPLAPLGGVILSCDAFDASDNCCVDLDADQVCDVADNCLGFANPEQEDSNEDGHGDACPPVVVVTADGEPVTGPFSVPSGTTVQFDTIASDEDGLGYPVFAAFNVHTIVTYIWGFGGASVPHPLWAFGSNPAVTFDLGQGGPRPFELSVTVYDSLGTSRQVPITVYVTEP